jgi:hypothetical protein
LRVAHVATQAGSWFATVPLFSRAPLTRYRYLNPEV